MSLITCASEVCPIVFVLVILGHVGKHLMQSHAFSLLMTETNMLYLESPIGVGFSYSYSSSDYLYYDDAMTGILFSIFLSDCCN